MDMFMIELANDPKPYRVRAANWGHDDDYVLTSYDADENVIDVWGQNDWFRVIGTNEKGLPMDLFVNPYVPNPKYA